MSRKHNVKEINLQIRGIIPFSNERHLGILIEWISDIGWGEYAIYSKTLTTGEVIWEADSECMDRGEDKEFLEELLRLFIQKINITS